MARRMISGALAALALAAMFGVGQLHAAQPAFAAGTPTCANSQLSTRLSADTHDNTQRYRFIVLTDTAQRCALRGRPDVSLGYHGRAVGLRGDYFPFNPIGRAPVVRTVTLGHGSSASIWIAVAVAGHTRCRLRQVDEFIVTLPHQHDRQIRLPLRERHRYTVCASRTSHELAFSQFLSGSGSGHERS